MHSSSLRNYPIRVLSGILKSFFGDPHVREVLQLLGEEKILRQHNWEKWFQIELATFLVNQGAEGVELEKRFHLRKSRSRSRNHIAVDISFNPKGLKDTLHLELKRTRKNKYAYKKVFTSVTSY